jgi:hypothetical protein
VKIRVLFLLVIDMDEERDTTESPWVRLYTVGNRFEADLLLHALEQEGIPVRLRTYEETPYDGLFVPQRGWGALFVPEEDEERGRELIDWILASAPQAPASLPGADEDEGGATVGGDAGTDGPA